eukprot:TRINITY_DN32891_c0_g1_i2.p1 TRINITY_DN32891_c0_g1~~TRINITY_DN32891_c0_g1_i2.p1  ORF type:complete len:908 (+),score=79.41 TRINITY_DN32891_c0_g1_i2:134-2857(+)
MARLANVQEEHDRFCGGMPLSGLSEFSRGQSMERCQSDEASLLGSSEAAMTYLHETTPRLPVSVDCFALVLVGEEYCPPIILLLAPLVCVIVQCTVLMYMATSNQYAFHDGVWLTPWSDRPFLMAMRLVALVLSLLKASGEFSSALALFQAVRLGSRAVKNTGQWRLSGESDSPGMPPALKRRQGRWPALVSVFLQFSMGVALAVTCAQIVLAETTPINTLIKVLSVWVVVDMDNYIAMYAVDLLDWRSMHWSVPCSREVAKIVTEETPGGKKRQDRTTMQLPYSQGSSGLPSGQIVYVAQSRWLRCAFLGIPAGVLMLEVLFSLTFNVLPFTYLTRGLVSNVDIPRLLSADQSLPAGCCPPISTALGHGDGWNFSVLLLAPTDSLGQWQQQPRKAAPVLFWVALEGAAAAPTSLQVVDGLDGDGFAAVQSGQLLSTQPAQAYYWLQMHGYVPEDTQKIYDALLGGEGAGLYKTHLAYSGHFLVEAFHRATTTTYKIYVTAQNPVSLALSPHPVVSAPLFIAGCAPGCIDCGGDADVCFQCSDASVWSEAERLCSPCAPGCKKCEQTGKGRCDAGACEEGYGLTADRTCAWCNVTSCSRCDIHGTVLISDEVTTRAHDASVGSASSAVADASFAQAPVQASLHCDVCKAGFGLTADGMRCSPCREHCTDCGNNGPAAASASSEASVIGGSTGSEVAAFLQCRSCETGYGLVPQMSAEGQKLSECVACGPNCLKCDDAQHCDQCERGFAAKDSQCAACADGCHNCTEAGPGKCDSEGCRRGRGYSGGMCWPCKAQHCTKCHFTDSGATNICDECADGYGLTEEGACEDCGDFCAACDRVGTCKMCVEGYAMARDSKGKHTGDCQSCSDRCADCYDSGPSRCDRCFPGFSLQVAERICLPSARAAVGGR